MRLPDRLGFRGKTLWDWLQLLIVPAILVAVTFAWSATQTRSNNKRDDRRIAADRAAAEEARQDTTLQVYLDQMSGLMLHEKLLSSKEGDAVRAVARTVTLATLRRLDAERRGQVVHFLYEARLLDTKNVRVDLTNADLSRADLSRSEFVGAYLGGADLRNANFTDDNLGGAYLGGADLTGAHFTRAGLVQADLVEAGLALADLRRAYLRGADFYTADLTDARLGGADLRDADFQGANLTGANLEGANLEGATLAGANLTGARTLNLDKFIAGLQRAGQKRFLDSEKTFLDSLSPDELAKFNLTREKLAKLRKGS